MDISLLFRDVEVQEVNVAAWSAAYDSWLSSKAENTQRMYQKAWEEFMALAGDEPWEASSSDVEEWLSSMRSKGLSSSTINQRISALSSFYRYVCEKYTVRPKENLHDFNPALAVDRPALKSYKEASYLTPDQVKAFIAAIEGNDPHTLRNRAMFLMYLFTGRRNTEVRKLTWGDFRKISKTLWQYRWEGKGSERWDMVPPPAMQAIQEYLKAIERWDGLQDDDYLFTALTANASRLPNVEDFEPHAKPISSSEVRRLVRRYVREAGIEAKDITVHSLRHTFVMLLREAKIDITEIQDIIGHSSSDVTKKYVHTLEGQQSAAWAAVSEVLGL